MPFGMRPRFTGDSEAGKIRATGRLNILFLNSIRVGSRGSDTTRIFSTLFRMNEFWAGIIRLIHAFVLLFIVATPVFGGEYLLTLHLVIVPFIMLHWLTNQTVCALTELEKLVRGCPDTEAFFGQIMVPIYKDESFVGEIISPFYKIEDKDTEKKAVWIGLTMLWLITLARLIPTGFEQLRYDLAHVRQMLRI